MLVDAEMTMYNRLLAIFLTGHYLSLPYTLGMNSKDIEDARSLCERRLPYGASAIF